MTDPLSALSVQDIVRQAAAPGSPDIQALSQQFDKLMAQQPEAAQSASHPSHEHTPLGDTVHALEEANRHLVTDMQNFSAEAPGMSMQEMTARGLELQQEMVTEHMRFTAVSSVGKSAKSGLQTLIKNQ